MDPLVLAISTKVIVKYMKYTDFFWYLVLAGGILEDQILGGAILASCVPSLCYPRLPFDTAPGCDVLPRR